MDNRQRVICCGGRDFEDMDLLAKTIRSVLEKRRIFAIWHGNASGADTVVDMWVRQNYPDIKVFPVPADWKKHGRAAGPIRNRVMLGNKIDLVIAFPGGRGTADMIKAARERGVEVLEVKP